MTFPKILNQNVFRDFSRELGITSDNQKLIENTIRNEVNNIINSYCYSLLYCSA
jgi:hypothetical protein